MFAEYIIYGDFKKEMIKQLLILTTFVFAMVSVVIAAPTNHLVTNTNDIGAGSFRQALANAVNGDSITVEPSLSADTLHLTSGQLEIASSVKIYGNGFTIDADSLSRVLYMNSLDSVLIDNLNITGGGIVREGAGIYASYIDSLTIQHCTISGNTASISTSYPSYGGGVYLFAYNSTVMFSNNIISGNKVSSTNSDGGGIYAFVSSSSSVTYSNNNIKGNAVTSTSTSGTSQGGGVCIFSSVTSSSVIFSNNTISGNTATSFSSSSSYGGGVNITSSSPVVFSNNTISGNTVFSSNFSSGGGVFASSSASSSSSVVFSSNTISGNTAYSSVSKSYGGGLYAYTSDTSATIIVSGNIIAENVAETGVDVRVFDNSIFNTLGYNLIGDNSDVSTLFPVGMPNANNDIVGTTGSEVDPLLSDLADNGGSTWTMALQASSPAINMGNPNSSELDQRGYSVYGRKDIGAFEFNGFVGVAHYFSQVNILDVYPNPTTGIVQIKGVNQMDYLLITNSFGQVVLEQKVQSKTATIDLSDLATGLYFVQVRSGKNTTVKRLLKN